MTASFERHLSAYIARRRIVEMIRAILWAADFLLGWLVMWCLIDRQFALGQSIRLGIWILGIGIAVAVLIYVYAGVLSFRISLKITSLLPRVGRASGRLARRWWAEGRPTFASHADRQVFFRLIPRSKTAAAFAMEIESRWPEFDQRLVTVASAPPPSALLSELRNQVETLLCTSPKKTRVPLRPLLLPLAILILLLTTLGLKPTLIHSPGGIVQNLPLAA